MKARLILLFLVTALAGCESPPQMAVSPIVPEAATTAAPATSPLATPQAAPATETQDLAWLLGTWELAYDPDGDDKDRLVFEEGGRLQLLALDGRVFEGSYALDGSIVWLSLQMNGKTAKLQGRISENRRRISNESGAYYERIR